MALGEHEHILRSLDVVVDHVHQLEAREGRGDVARYPLRDIEDALPVALAALASLLLAFVSDEVDMRRALEKSCEVPVLLIHPAVQAALLDIEGFH
jgi:hypothetical protein